MTSLKLVGLAAIVASALATPALAQTAADNAARCAGLFQDPSCQNLGPGHPANDRAYRRRHMAHRQMNPNDGTQSGFAPLDAADAVAGAAVGTAAAVASAPFQGWGNSYASYDRGGPAWYGDWNAYAARNGIVCRPGTWFKGDDGRQHLCQ
ncbi:hypothetical protein L6654_36625 [Bradyrhizobium sp. WYCCWR 13023]|uniref:Uncharacterized protein n=1 Tax=Bradyrhizobium zhengyangense TaxID=2911009 RepID=A0A9X1RIU3_9BRAD|nr:hypothetical protein [Bradyrhizobium zhengyangense]MCG2632148.1 hypothetical protein [Bradyrhizobium zhengyangense]MCG2639595.1 hypothetical protein [Bradyrhizobium zhengyangense]MCG2672917.1 hypothetical protein [Bradyrhizobium zhengyangense]